MFFEFNTLDGHHVMLREDVIWMVTKVEGDSPSEIVLQGGQSSIKISGGVAEDLQIALAHLGE